MTLAISISVRQEHTQQFRAALKQTTQGLFDMSRVAADVRAENGYQPYIEWLKNEFGLSRQTGDNLLNIHKNILMSTLNFSIEALERLAPSALYILAAPATPDTARAETIERLGSGETITHGKMQDIATDHREAVHSSISDEDFERQIGEAEDEPLTDYGRIHELRDKLERQRLQQTQLITGSSESNEWYTPAHIVNIAREVLGDIDLDPATSEEANKIVNAPSYCTMAEDGFNQPWFGRVWLNPPYGTTGEGAAGWAQKLIREYELGQVEGAILLVKAAFGYNWFNELWYAYPTCILRERVTFISPIDGTTRGPAKHATVLFYFGPNAGRFRALFSLLGRVIMPNETE